LVFTLAFAVLSGFSLTAQAATTYQVEGVSLPLKKHPDGGRSYGKDKCWAFAEMVYKKIWGQSLTCYRGTADDFLRDVATGKDRAITAKNTKLFVEQIPLGANIRVADNINGGDRNGHNRHSQILVQKDESGFAVYESVNKMVRVRYYTWQQYATKYAPYKYFKYIKFPVGKVTKITPEIIPEEIPEKEILPKENFKEDLIKKLDGISEGAQSTQGAQSTIRGITFDRWSEWLLVGSPLPLMTIETPH
ncbi:MAG TPA: hypothetical protein VFD23_01505, partial [Clostridia bacterium]|nr:hypothetical protein [Clostridia bacterium]